jgi:hypothetical protein
MSQSEMRLYRAHTITGLWITFAAFLYFNNPIIVRIARKAGHPICRHLVLKVNFRDWRTVVVGMQVPLSDHVPDLDA